MARVIYVVFLSIFMFLIPNESTNAQSSKKVIIKKTVKRKNKVGRISSKTVKYKKPKRKVVSIRTLPTNRRVIKHNSSNYYYANNRFYTYSGGRYIVIAPKIGFRVRTLPVGYRKVVFRGRNYFSFNGVFYLQKDNEYEVVEPEIGTIVYELPDEYERVTINNNTYYEFSNVLYEKIQVNGTRAYEIIGFVEQ